ncbi:unnamed protein product, partial [Staurois parvus]
HLPQSQTLDTDHPCPVHRDWTPSTCPPRRLWTLFTSSIEIQPLAPSSLYTSRTLIPLTQQDALRSSLRPLSLSGGLLGSRTESANPKFHQARVPVRRRTHRGFWVCGQ